MKLKASKEDLKSILPLRNLFLQENNFQIRYNACHERGWSDSYLLSAENLILGYGSVKGNERNSDRDTIFEFYILPAFRDQVLVAFQELVHASKSTFVTSQTNEKVLSSLTKQFVSDIRTEAILFEDDHTTQLFINEGIFRKREGQDVIFKHHAEPVGDFVVEINNEVVATGGFLLHYNFPFADIYMEVSEDWQKRGVGSFLVQEIKKQCYLSGRVPAARCGPDNPGSRATLIKAGMRIAGEVIIGKIV